MADRVATLQVGSSMFDSPSDGAMIFEGPSDEALEQLIERPAYQDFLQQTSADYIAVYQRRI